MTRLAGLMVAGLIFPVIAPAASSTVLLGVDYSVQVGQPAGGTQITVDTQGGVYVVADGLLVKLNAAGARVWQANFGFVPVAIAADSAGDVYAVPPPGSAFIGRAYADGTVNPNKLALASGLTPGFIVVDASEHVWVAGTTMPGVSNPLAASAGAYQQMLPNTTGSHVFIARFNTAGTAIEYATYLAGSGNDAVAGIGVDSTGSLTIAGTTTSADFPLTTNTVVSGSSTFLTRLKPDGSGLIYSTIVSGSGTADSLGVDAGGNAVLTLVSPPLSLKLVRYAADGTLSFMRQGSSVGNAIGLDASGNIYSTGMALGGNYPVKNSVATCSGPFLTVFSASGNILQATWLPASPGSGSTGIVVAADSAVSIAGVSYGHPSVEAVTRLSPNPAAKVVTLGCLTDAAAFLVPGAMQSRPGQYSNMSGGVVPGEIVSLFGTGLGPQVGTQPAVTSGGRFPDERSSVKVEFDGQPAPLLYVQDSQINAIAPWALSPGKNTEACVTYAGTQTNCLTIPVVEAAPAVFTTDGYYAAAVNQDGTLNSGQHPAPPGTIVSIFATGLGPISPVQPDGGIIGFPLPADQFVVTAEALSSFVGSMPIPFDVTYYGPAPFQVAGLSQINLRIPATESSTGHILDIYVHVANATTKFTIIVGLPAL